MSAKNRNVADSGNTQEQQTDSDVATITFDSEESLEAERHEIASLSNSMSLGSGNYRTMPRFND